MNDSRTVSTLCRMCPQNCGMDVEVENDEPVRVQGNKRHPFNRGWLCAKGLAALDLFRSPERLKTPYIRRGERLEPVAWETALSFAAERLLRLKDTCGPESVAIYYGEGGGHQEIKYYIQRFANVFGTPNFSGVGSICNFARTLADTLTLGGVTKPDIANSRFMIVWGGNPFASNEPSTPRDINRFVKRGGQLVVIDPRRTEAAARAAIHLAVRPGQDETLVLNLIHTVLRDGLWDREFTDRWVHGFEDFHRRVCADRFSPERGAAATGVPAELVKRVARSYASAPAACCTMGNGLEHHAGGMRAMRLVSILKAITGNIDVPGGDLFTDAPKLKQMTKAVSEPDVPPVGLDDYPVFCKLRKEARALSLPRAILEERPYPIKGMVISGGNTTMEWPDSGQVRRALQKLEFLMVVDVVHSPDSRYADVVLPACTFLERDEHHVNIYQNLHTISLRQKVVDPVYGRPDQMIWVELAKRMGYEAYFPWKSCREGIDFLLEDLGVTFTQIASMGGVYEYAQRTYRQFEPQGFRTVTGKVEIFSERLKALGFDPSPVGEAPNRLQADGDAFPLTLTTGANLLSYLHWQYRYIPRLRKMNPDPVFEIHPRTARQYGVSEGGTARIQTRSGSIQLKARVTDTIRADTLHIAQGWETANANELTSSADTDPVSGFPNLKSIGCRITPGHCVSDDDS